MLELLDKIKFKKLWFVLLLLPLLFTPVEGLRDGWGTYYGIALGGPFMLLPEVLVWQVNLDLDPERTRYVFIDWGRIAYWDAWMLAICFVVNRKRLLQDKEQ